MGKGTAASGKPTGALRALGPDEARCINAGPRGTPERHAAGHNRGTRTGAKRQWPPGAANSGRTHNSQRTPAQEHVSGNTQPTHRNSWPVMAGYRHRVHTDTHTPKPQPGVAGRSPNPSPSTHTHTAHPSQDWWGKAGACTQTHKLPNTPARNGGVQPEGAHREKHPNTPKAGLAGRSRSMSPSTHTQTAHPSHDWRGTGGARTETHTHPNTPARNGRVQAEGAYRHTHPNIPARSGRAQPKAEPKHTYPHRAPQPGWAGYKPGAHTNTHTPQHPSQEWSGAGGTRARAHTPTPHTPAKIIAVQEERAHKHTQTPTPEPGMAGYRQRVHTDTHT